MHVAIAIYSDFILKVFSLLEATIKINLEMIRKDDDLISLYRLYMYACITVLWKNPSVRDCI